MESLYLEYTELYEVKANRGGKEYVSLEKLPVFDYKNNEIAVVDKISPLMVSLCLRDLKKGLEKIRNPKLLPIEELMEIIKEAGNVFSKENELEVSYSEWKEMVTKATGLPVSDVENSGEMLKKTCKRIDEIIEAQTPWGNLKSYDTYMIKDNVAYIPKGNSLGVITPSNHPAVHSLWLIALGLRYPLLHRPSNEEPFTGERLTKSLYHAGLPENTIYFLPGDHEVANEILESCDLGIIFGGPEVVKKYRSNPKIKVFGPGNSKILVDEEFSDDEKVYKTIKTSMMKDGGRGCINISQVIGVGELDEMMEKLAEDVTSLKYYDPLDKRACIPAVKEKVAKMFEKYIKKNLNGAEDITAKYFEEIIVKNDEATFLRPTIIKLEYEDLKKREYSHPLWAEFPFQYLAYVDNVPKDELGTLLKGTLTLSLFTKDRKLLKKVKLNPWIEKVYLGKATYEINLTEPHEGFLTDFLYKKKAFRE